MAFSSGSEASSDASSARDARRSLYGLTMGDSSGIGRGGTPGAAHRVAGVAMFEDAPTARAGGRKDAKGSTFASMAFADMENENQASALLADAVFADTVACNIIGAWQGCRLFPMHRWQQWNPILVASSSMHASECKYLCTV